MMTRFGKIARLRLVSATRAARAEPSRCTSSLRMRVDIGLGVLAIDRNPARHRPAAIVRIVGGEMAVAEIAAEAARRQQFALRRRDVDAGIAHVVEPGRVRRDQVIIVDAVLDQKLPVGADVVFLRAGNDLHLAGRRLVDDEIDVFLGLAEIGVEIDGVAIEIGEIEVAIGFEPRHRRRGPCRSLSKSRP